MARAALIPFGAPMPTRHYQLGTLTIKTCEMAFFIVGAKLVLANTSLRKNRASNLLSTMRFHFATRSWASRVGVMIGGTTTANLRRRNSRGCPPKKSLDASGGNVFLN